MSALVGAMVRAMPRALAFALLALCGVAARADTPLALFQAFRGQVNFTGTEETLRTKGNNQPCRLVNAGSGISARLAAIPAGAKILSAQLVWAGSGSKPDYTVTFDGVVYTAVTNRRYTSSTIGAGYNYFSGAADVTSQVAAKGNGTYSFSGLSVDNGNPWCSVQGVVGGFALLVVYSHPNESYRLLNLYEGFQYFRNSGFTLNLNNFAIPDPLAASATGRIGHITWEGDGTLSGGGEDLLFNGYEMTDALNPSGNQFNSASNVTGDKTSYGIDFDAYTVGYPVIKPGQTTASTTYRSGQDMVLLSAEVAALPYVPTADLALSMTRSGALQVGSTAAYTLTVTNNGADTETGPVTVVDTLPSGLGLVSARGTGWSCVSSVNGAGQTIVTCTANGPVASGAAMNPLTLTVNPARAGNYGNSATVTGKTGDTNLANNTASDSGAATDASSSAAFFVFTSRACVAGEAISPPAQNGCPLFHGPVTAGDNTVQIFITNVTGSAAAPTATAVAATDTRLTVPLTLSCSTNSGVSASYAGVQLACGKQQNVSLDFQPNKPSAVLPDGTSAAAFSYLDVGQLGLAAAYGTTVPLSFVSSPAGVVIYKVVRHADQVADLHVPGTTPADVAFAVAGESFDVQLAATMLKTTRYAPSFGSESTKPPVTLSVASLANSTEPLEYVDRFTKPGNDGTGANGVGLLVGTLQWYEAGLLTLGGSVNDYLGTGPGDVPLFDIGTRTVGRFYPDHLTTTFNAPFACLPAMACTARVADPANPVYGVDGAAYSGQPLNVTVTAYGLNRGGQPRVLALYNPPQAVLLDAFSQPNGAQAAAPGSFPEVKLNATQNTDQDGKLSYALSGQVKYQLALPYDPAKPHAGNWSAPQAVYLRATTQDQKMTAAGAQSLTITSQNVSPPTAPLAPQQEDGIELVAGRLFVGNVFGSELTQLPLPLSAQYWTGTLWQTNTSDSDSVVATSLKFSNCKRDFAASCQLTALTPAAVPTNGGAGLQLSDGSGRLTLKAPPRGQNGSLDITAVNDASGTSATANPAAATWLPSTTGRATFGLFKSPLIYFREVY